MSSRHLVAGLFVCLALAFTACGEDDEEKGGSTTGTTATAGTTTSGAAPAEGATLDKSVPPLAAAPNVAGGDAPIDKFVRDYAEQAVGYWVEVFGENGLTYARPAVDVAKAPTRCGSEQFDPAESIYAICRNGSATRLVYGGPALTKARDRLGDAAVAFISGYGASLDALDQIEGRPLAKQQPVGDKFTYGAVCFTGAWIAHITKKNLLQAGDNQELLSTVERIVPGQTDLGVSLGQDLLANGLTNGAGACLREVRG
jgi:hypothetical protein